jgi:hypothetical protein
MHLPALWTRILLHSLPWTAAVLGWILAAGFIVYSHGQADRLRANRQTLTATIGGLQSQLAQASVVQNFVSTPQIQVVALQSPRLAHLRASVNLIYSAQYATALLVARGLPFLPRGRVYTIWVRGDGGPYIRLGTLTIRGVGHNGVAVVVGPRTFEHYTTVELIIESSRASRQPATSIVGTAAISPTATQ